MGFEVPTYEVEHNDEDDVRKDEDHEVFPADCFNRDGGDLDKHDDDSWQGVSLQYNDG